MPKRFLVLITLIIEAYEAKFSNDPIFYKGRIKEGALSYFETLCENGQTLIIQILDSILAGTFTNTLRSLGGNLVFKFGKKGGQLKSLFNLALKSFDSGSVVCFLKPKDLKVKMVEYGNTCHDCLNSNCYSDIFCGGIKPLGNTKMMSITDASSAKTKPFEAGWSPVRDIDDLPRFTGCLLIFQNKIGMGLVVSRLLSKELFLPACFTSLKLTVDGKVLIEPDYTCGTRKLVITEYTTVCFKGVCGDSLIDTFLYRFWSDPQKDAGPGRVLSRSRQQMVWTVMHSAYKSSKVLELLPVLKPKLWMLVFTFVKNEQPPM